MRRRVRTTLTLTTAAALALPLALAAAPAGADEPAPPAVPLPALDEDTSAVSRAVVEAAEEARKQASARTFGAPSETSAKGVHEVKEGLEQGLDDTVAGVPVGIVARVDAPGLRWSGAAGTRALDGRGPALPWDRFRVASNTKSMVATLVMQEVERGTWSLDTLVVDALPAAADVIPDRYEDQVTLEHLLTHRSGLPDHLGVLTASRMDDPTDLDEFFEVLGEKYTTADHLAAMAAQDWLFAPDTDVSYSNAGYVLLGLALEEATGRSLERLLETRVFRPAGMWRSDYPDDPRVRGRSLEGAAFTGDQGAGWYPLGHFDPSQFGAAGAVTSTTGDLQRFSEALLTGDLLAPETVADVVTPRTVDDDVLPDYGLGVYRLPDPCHEGEWLYGHDGASYGTLSINLASPDGERQVTVALTGRSLVDPAQSDMSAALVPALLATC
ncbi:serine hydrolase [Isoptericola sp. BMS4]|uniref:serine hydrolase domain-containing protein n=1 Tax=Isoptericola sp. BMS4 TaxID=2527875 RepID=UPI001421D0F5|nr:serine hydrolase domain-containing protein [Isoptericola sp. BMS4]